MVTGMEVIFFLVFLQKNGKKPSALDSQKEGKKQVVILPEAQLTASTKKRRRKKSTVCAERCVTEESQSF